MTKKEKHISSSRREVISKLIKTSGFVGFGGVLWGGLASKASAADFVLRPPGALEEKDFLKKCIKCGTCVAACPYDTLKLAKPESKQALGTPYFTPREVPCSMCTDIPCTVECPSGALDISMLQDEDPATKEKKLNINKTQMGLAVIDKASCVAYWGIQCDACYRACPLIDEAITLKYERNERTGKHALLIPIVQEDKCTGCGICEHKCITEKAAIFVLPRKIALGKTGTHYIKSWDKEDEKRLDAISQKELEESNKATIDYLNDMEGIIDE